MYAAVMDAPSYRARLHVTLDAAMYYRSIDAHELAVRVGVSDETARRWHRGDTSPGPEAVGLIARALDVAPELLLYPPATREAALTALVLAEELRDRLARGE